LQRKNAEACDKRVQVPHTRPDDITEVAASSPTYWKRSAVFRSTILEAGSSAAITIVEVVSDLLEPLYFARRNIRLSIALRAASQRWSTLKSAFPFSATRHVRKRFARFVLLALKE